MAFSVPTGHHSDVRGHGRGGSERGGILRVRAGVAAGGSIVSVNAPHRWPITREASASRFADPPPSSYFNGRSKIAGSLLEFYTRIVNTPDTLL